MPGVAGRYGRQWPMAVVMAGQVIVIDCPGHWSPHPLTLQHWRNLLKGLGSKFEALATHVFPVTWPDARFHILISRKAD